MSSFRVAEAARKSEMLGGKLGPRLKSALGFIIHSVKTCIFFELFSWSRFHTVLFSKCSESSNCEVMCFKISTYCVSCL